MSDVLDLLRRHDAEPARPLTDAEAARADQLLHAITAEVPARDHAQTGDAATRVAPRRSAPRRRRALLVTGLVTATAVVGGAVLVSSGSLGLLVRNAGGLAGPTAISAADVGTWTPTAQRLPATASVHDRAVDCLTGFGDPGSTTPDPDRVTTSNVQQRGAVTSLIASSGPDGPRVWCLVGSGGSTRELIDSGTTRLAPVGADAVDLQSSGSSGDGPATIAEAYGQVGSDVTSLTVDVPGQPSAAVPVANGLWSLWWPGDDTAGNDLSAITVSWTTRSGGVHHGTLASIAWDARR